MINQPFLTVGLLIEHEGARFECIRDLGETYEFQNIETGQIKCMTSLEILLGIGTQAIKAVPAKVTPNCIDPVETSRNSRDILSLSDANQRRLDIRLTYILGMVKRGISRGRLKLLAEAAVEITAEINGARREGEKPVLCPSHATLNRWMRSYEQGNQEIIAVVPKTAFRVQVKRVDPQNELLISEAFEESLFTDGKGRIADLLSDYETKVSRYNNVARTQGNEPLMPVGRSTIVRRFHEIPSYDRDVAIHGVQAARVNHRVAKGHLPSQFALQFVEIDHGQIDTYVIDDLLFVPLGIPWITILRDRHTGIVLGFYISFRKTSLQSIFGAMRHSITPHTRVMELWPDIQSPWPFGFAFVYVSDRGADFLSPRYRLAIREFGSDAIYCERRTPWHKAPIERFIGHTNRGLIEALPGRTYPFRTAPLGYDARKQAVVRFSTLVYLVHKWIAEFYHHQAHSRKLASPLTRWERSLAEMPIPVPPGPESFLVMTGERFDRTISQEGIIHNWLNYGSPVLEELCEDLGRVKIPYISNPENLGYGLAIDPRSNTSFRVNCMSSEYARGLSSAQHQYVRRQAKISLTRENAEAVLTRTKQEIQEALAEEILSKDSADKSRLYQAAIRAGIDSNAVLDGKPRSIADILKLARERGAPADQPDAKQSVAVTDVPHFACI